MINVQAAVARSGAAEFSLETLALSEPRQDEVLVRFSAAGLCHTDLTAAAGLLPTPLPAVLGHEGTGVVVAVGDAVTGVSEGDVVVCSVDSCGGCAQCHAGLPAYCDHHNALNFAASRTDGTVGLTDADGQQVHDHFFGQSSFADHGLTHANGLTVVDPAVPPEILAPLGCGVLTGAGAVWNSLAVTPGSRVAVFGLGTVGLAAIIAASVSGAQSIIAIDTNPRRLARAAAFGATDVVDPSATSVPDALAESTLGAGVDFSVECTGVPAVMEQAVRGLAARGSAAILGVAGPDATFAVPAFDLLKGRSVVGSVMGHQHPGPLIDKILALYRQGRFPIERLVTTYPLAAVNTAVDDVRTGSTIKAVLLHDH